jgi:crotonobetainyl-CoA:carnitine CoA-transferase CaiB-like acyl-CoA transferase
MQHALSDIRVLDITQVMAGPFCSMLLCDMGADVIKVEPPDGDATRRFAGFKDNDSQAFNAVNRGKRGIVIDLKTSEGAGIVRELSTKADVLIENYRPGVMTKFGLDYDSLHALNPRLIYVSISGYGQTGPSRTKGGWDLIAQGLSGIMSVTGEPGRPPVKCGLPITDLGAGLFALGGILAALHHRSKSGEGQLIDTSLLDAGVALSVWETTQYLSGGGVPERLGSAHRMTAPYQAIRCADGYITLGGANDRLFKRVSQALGHAEWTLDPLFATNTARVKNHLILAQKIEEVTHLKPRRYWVELFEEFEIPCGPINTYAETLLDPQVLARDMVQETEHPTLGQLQTIGTPLKLSVTPLTVDRPAPLLGQHTSQNLNEIGFTAKEISGFRENRVVK